MDARVRTLAAAQADVVAAWQLRAIGLNRRMIEHRVAREAWRAVHPGVYVLSHGPLTRCQRWMAASVTAPDCVLSHASAAACWGFRPFDAGFETVTRPGSGGPRRTGALLVCRSRTLAGGTTSHNGIRITTAARTLVDLAAHLRAREIGKALREALRLKVTTAAEMQSAVERHRGRRGTKTLAELARRYVGLPYGRTRSDAEARALELLHDAGAEPPEVNLRVAGEEADLVWPERRLIIEIDGPQYHLFPEEDARKARRWKAAGYTVRRVRSDAVYDRPEGLVALVSG